MQTSDSGPCSGGLITLIHRYGILSMGKLLSYLLRMRQTRAGELCLMHYRVKGLNNVQGVDGHWRRNLSISTDYNLKQVFWDFNRSVRIFPMRISKCIYILYTCSIAYLNHQGSMRPVYCDKLAHSIWAFCQQRNLWITAAQLTWPVEYVGRCEIAHF